MVTVRNMGRRGNKWYPTKTLKRVEKASSAVQPPSGPREAT